MKAIMDPIKDKELFDNAPATIFGNLLREIRRRKKITQRQAAESIGMDFAYWSRLENGRLDSLPTEKTINAICIALKCDVAEQDALLVSAGRKCQHAVEIEALRNLREICGMYCEQLPVEVKEALHAIPEIEKTHNCDTLKIRQWPKEI